jgi:hypothetical protein
MPDWPLPQPDELFALGLLGQNPKGLDDPDMKIARSARLPGNVGTPALIRRTNVPDLRSCQLYIMLTQAMHTKLPNNLYADL